jgi:hypothetical protein
VYSTEARFIFELIQNAEDNDYTSAIGAGKDPFLRFSLYPNRLLVECNENGFKEAHVRDICSIGDSSKSHHRNTDEEGYIGEKGIGFKSVFNVAKKVHIQSEPFSFAFEHDRHSDADEGLGMITPINHDYEDLPGDVQTRFTLSLLDSTLETSSFEKRREELENLPDPLLLFLKKLVELQVNVYPNTKQSTQTTYRVSSRGQDLETITKTVNLNGESMRTTHRYHVVRRKIQNLPHHDARKNIRQASVVLAFPVNDNEEPALERQHVYAYLPLREVGYTVSGAAALVRMFALCILRSWPHLGFYSRIQFLVQSDFITQANREDVVECPWNRALLRGVAETFRDAVLRFCRRHDLQACWMRYLPSDANAFWRDLRPQLVDLLRSTDILWSRRDRRLHRPELLRIVTSDFKDQYGNPLLEDLPREIYLSEQYLTSDYPLLRALGAKTITPDEVLDRLEADLNRTNSRYRSKTIGADWHSRLSKLFLRAYKSGRKIVTNRLETMRLIPLEGADSWVSARSLPIYFPHINGTRIPTDLNLRLVRTDLTRHLDRKALITHMGITIATVADITEIICSRYTSIQSLNVDDAAVHLAFIFLEAGEDTRLDPRIWLVSQINKRVNLSGDSKRHIYFGDKDETYSPYSLLSSATDENSNRSPVAHFLNPQYLSAVPPAVMRQGRTWREWLKEVVGVRENPQLLDETGQDLSREYHFIIKSKPETLPGLLNRYWAISHSQIRVVENQVKQSLISCQMPEAQPLSETYLPLTTLRATVEDMGIEHFPFLLVSEDLAGSTRHDWTCLNRLGIGLDQDLSFYRDVLRRFADETDPPKVVERLATKVFGLYRKLSEHCITAEHSASMKYVTLIVIR